MRGTALVLILGTGLLVGACEGKPREVPPPVGKPAVGSGVSVVFITIDTLRADHLSAYGYRRETSPHLDALARRGTLFEQAYTFWPKTRGSFVAMLTGKPPSRTGYGKTHPMLLDLNPTLASVLQSAGYETKAVVDNPNVAASLGYAKGFSSYRETWQEKELRTETDRAHAITEAGLSFLKAARPDRPFFLWLHYVNPHAPYEPPPPFDRQFSEGEASGPRLSVVEDFHGGIPKRWAVPGRDRLGFYVSQYDGEIAAVDAEVGRVVEALDRSAVRDRALVLVTSDHGESLGEHGYYFDHGENLFDPSLRVPLIVVAPGAPAGRRVFGFASTLDVVPTVLDAAKVSWPPDLAGRSLLKAVEGGTVPAPERLFAQNDRNLSAAFSRTSKIVAFPEEARQRFALYDRAKDPGETKDVAALRPEALREERRELELFLERADREWARMRPLLEGRPGEGMLSPEACERLKALGYVIAGCP
ncbi:MAG TPA: sulfatase [Vicinamibacteria bacterium]